MENIVNRVIKFRIWDKQNDKWSTVRNLLLDRIGEDRYYNFSIEDYERFVFQQFVGLTDKNGKEIFEGDIVKAPLNGRIYEVEFGTYRCGYSDRGDDFEHGFYIKDEDGEAENIAGAEQYLIIIGNIFENKKLLKNM